jgi:hypothetical protein
MPTPLVADAVKSPHVRDGATAAASHTGAGKKIWIDLENTPHIPFFKPIIRELDQRGYTVVLTARDAFQVCESADKFGLPYKKSDRRYPARQDGGYTLRLSGTAGCSPAFRIGLIPTRSCGL